MIDRNELIVDLYTFQEAVYDMELENFRERLWNMTDNELQTVHQQRFEDD